VIPESLLASQFHAHPVQIGQWRKTALEQLADLFTDGRKSKRPGDEVEKDALYEEIGRLKVELDWLKKKLVCSTEERRLLVEAENAARQISTNAGRAV
jgi:putative transposase